MDTTSSTNYPENTIAKVLGYWSINDGGGGEFRLQRTGTLASDNGGTVIAPTTGVGRWVRVCDPGFINVLWFGARPFPNPDPSDTTRHDSLAAINSAFVSLPQIHTPGSNINPDEDGEYGHAGVLYFPNIVYKKSNGEPLDSGNDATIYYLSDTLVVSQHTTIRGDSMSHSSISFLDSVATSASTEKFVIYFARASEYASPPGNPSANVTFDCVVEKIAIGGSGETNPGGSGIFMDPAQMSYIRDASVYASLRSIVGAPYTIDNVTMWAGRGPCLEITNDQPALTPPGGAINGSAGDTKTHASNLFVTCTSTTTDPESGYPYAAIKLNRIHLFTCDDLRAEDCTQILYAKDSQKLVISSIDTTPFHSGFNPTSATAIFLDGVGNAQIDAMTVPNSGDQYSNQGYAIILLDKFPSWTGFPDKTYGTAGSYLTSFHRGHVAEGGWISSSLTLPLVEPFVEWCDFHGHHFNKSTVDGSLTSGGALSAATLSTTGNATIGGTVNGVTLSSGAMSGASVSASGSLSGATLSTTGNATIGGTVNGVTLSSGNVNGGSLTASGALSGATLSTTGNATIGGTINGVTLSAGNITASSLTTTGSSTTGGTLTVNGGLTVPAGVTFNILSPLSLSGSAGTSGQVLTSAGSGAVPTWSTPTVRLLGKRSSATSAIANTETQVLGVTIPANTLAVGDVLRLRAFGLQTNTTTASTSVYRMRVGTTTLTGTVPANASWVNGTTAKTNIIIEVCADVLVTAIGSSGTMIGQLNVNKGYASATTPTGVTTAVTVNTTANNIFEFTFVSGAASTSNTFHTATLEMLH